MQNCLKLILLVIVSSGVYWDAKFAIATTNEKRVALIIGNSNYHHIPPLANPQNDASAIGNSFKKLGFATEIKLNLSKSEMDQVIRQFSESLSGANVAVFYYAGHGIQVNGVNYLVPVDAALRTEIDLAFEVCDLGLVLRVMESSQRLNIVFLDACRDNPMSEKLARSMGPGRSASVGRGLAPIKANAGTLISYATRDGDVASDGYDKNSPYTKALLKYLEQPGLEIHQLLRNVRNEVRLQTNGKQTPWEYGSLLNEFYFLAPVKIEVQSPDENSQKLQSEVVYWQTIMNETNPAVFELYLKKFPSGVYADLARLKIEALTKTEKTMSPPVKSPVSKGSLSIDSEPSGASVLMDGLSIGRTTIKIDDLDAGRKHIEVHKDCYRTEKKDVVVTAGREERLNIMLTPVCGKLAVESEPSGADVWIAGRNIGRTPLTLENMPEGDYAAVIHLTGYQEKRIFLNVKAAKEPVLEKIALDRNIPVQPDKSIERVLAAPLPNADAVQKPPRSANEEDANPVLKITDNQDSRQQTVIEKEPNKPKSIEGKYSLLALPFSYGNDAQTLDQKLASISNKSIRKSACFELTYSYLAGAGSDDRSHKLNAQDVSAQIWSNDTLNIQQPIEIGKKYHVDFVLGGFISATRAQSTADSLRMNKIMLFLVDIDTGKHVEVESSSSLSSTEDEFEMLLNRLITRACKSKL